MTTDVINVRASSPSYQAYQILHVAFTVAPIVAGMDKFFHFLVNWDIYLSPLVEKTLGISAHSFMLGVGVGYTIGTGGTAIAALIADDLLPQVVGEDARHIGALMTRLRAHIRALTPGCISSNALAAIDIALWDLAGHRAHTPLHVLLG